ncbi:MAG TPA: chitobiase/beta-hexosaminidase C-terminal domain-containing protein, partial [bacterium]|nr:chitobiase/beta-hexosaminidase C-terminal domain-containing protein [bacterium]
MKKITAIILLFLVAACAQDPGDLQETTHKNMDKLIAEGTVCENGTVRDISCGTGDQGTQHQKCESGVWVDVGGCEYCENDDVRTIPCGTDNTGGQRQKCVEAVWVDVGGCEYCEDGDTRVVPCGTENKGEQQQECVAGVWTDTSTCEYCTNGDERTIKCGLNGRGEKPQKCVEGAWADDGDCIDPDECLDDDTRDLEKGCGLNGQGTQPQICVEGKWENTGTCTDKVSDPEFSSPSGTYQTTQNIVLSSQTAGTTIRYTINGDEPTVASLVYTAPIEIPSNQTSETLRTIKAKAYKTGYTESDIVEANYTITGTAATPQYNVLPGAYNTNKMVTITTGTTGASIRYTINGDDPTDEIGTPYTEPVEITATTTLKAVAYKTNWVNSAVQSVTYTLKMADPAFSVPAGTYATTQNIELSTISPNAEIRYTTNGDEPTETSTLYTGAISLPTNQTDEMTTTIKAKVFSTEFGWEDSGIVERTYRITGTVATPVLSPDEGTYTT